MKPWKKIGLAIVAIATISTMFNITTRNAQANTSESSTPTNGLGQVEAASSGPKFDVWMDGEAHTTSKGYYTGVQKGTVWILTFRGDIPGAYIDNMLSWDTTTGKGLWKSEEHRNGKPGQRANGKTEVGSNADGTLTLTLLDESGNKEYSTGRIIPQ